MHPSRRSKEARRSYIHEPIWRPELGGGPEANRSLLVEQDSAVDCRQLNAHCQQNVPSSSDECKRCHGPKGPFRADCDGAGGFWTSVITLNYFISHHIGIILVLHVMTGK